MKIWKAHFRDEKHDVFTDIVNTEGDYRTDPLSLTIDGVTFAGTGLCDLHPAAGTDMAKACERFNILKQGGFEVADSDVPYWYTLQRYALDVSIPVTVVRRCDNCEVEGILQYSFEFTEHDPGNIQAICLCDGERVYPDDVNVLDFTLYIDGTGYSSEKRTVCFENALMDISRKISPDYYLKCCFTCRYSDYSPYGSDDFGSMECFSRQKESP